MQNPGMGMHMKFRSRIAPAGGAIMFSLLSAASAQQQLAALPNGASSLREVYQDWSVACSLRENTKVCSLSQDQVQENGQRLLAVEVQRRADGSATAALLLPFGILLDSGVTPQIDDQPPLSPLRFRTCQPTGCLAVFSIDPPTLAKMREGSVLKLNVTTAAETQLTFPVSLRGLTIALDRMAALTAN
jgi:invasion protein IalB